jgi:hypothetical protein
MVAGRAPKLRYFPDAGGLVQGNSDSGTIVASSAHVNITGPSGWAGGLAAWNEGSISLSNAHGAISGHIVGGLVAYNYNAIDQSFATGAVAGGLAAGGLAGYNYGDASPAPTITNSYASGDVKAGGGFVYAQETTAEGEIEFSYATGSVPARSGGFECSWYSINPVADDYWDTTTSGTDDGVCGGNTSGITGLTTQQLKSGLPAGFDPTIWAESKKINNGLPYLINNPPQ